MRTLTALMALLLLFDSCDGQELLADVHCTSSTSFNISETECYLCKCENNVPECSHHFCPIAPCANPLPPTEDDCCRRCPGCVYLGRAYSDGAVWPAPHDKCSRNRCKAGIVTMYRVGCPCRFSTGPDCRSVENETTSCSRDACPVLECPVWQQVRPADECCPQCAHLKRSPSTSESTNACRVQGKGHPDGSRIRVDSCTQCECSNGALLCKRHVCKSAFAQSDPHCCSSFCYLSRKGKPEIRKHGSAWETPSSVCYCNSSRIDCTPKGAENNTRLTCSTVDRSFRGAGDAMLLSLPCEYTLIVNERLRIVLRLVSSTKRQLNIAFFNETYSVIVQLSTDEEEIPSITISSRTVLPPVVQFVPYPYSISMNGPTIILSISGHEIHDQMTVLWDGRDATLYSSSLRGKGLCLSSPAAKFSEGRSCSQYYHIPLPIPTTAL